MEAIRAKSILSKLKDAPDSWFGLTYNMNLYRGCQHQCIYCDTRSDCYGIGDLANIRYKENAIDLLEKELKSKKERATIGTGSMNDPYMPVEKQLGLTRKALSVIERHKFPCILLQRAI
jgi:DNA repair photolyase